MLILKHCNIAILFPPAVGLDFQLERGGKKDRAIEGLEKVKPQDACQYLLLS